MKNTETHTCDAEMPISFPLENVEFLFAVMQASDPSPSIDVPLHRLLQKKKEKRNTARLMCNFDLVDVCSKSWQGTYESKRGAEWIFVWWQMNTHIPALLVSAATPEITSETVSNIAYCC